MRDKKETLEHEVEKCSRVIIYSTGIFASNNIHELIHCFLNSFIQIVISLFFVGVSAYVWLLYILNVLVKPQNRVLYLRRIAEDNVCEFIDQKKRVFYFQNNNYEPEKFYSVLKTYSHIHQIVDVSPDSFEIVGEKKSYWLNLYTPVGDFENLLLLPIVYIILLIGVIGTITAEGFEKNFGVLFAIVPAFIIFYDGWYKLREKRNFDKGLEFSKEDEDIETMKEKFLKIYILLPYIMTVIFLALILINAVNVIIVRIVLLPFFIYFLYKLYKGIIDFFS